MAAKQNFARFIEAYSQNTAGSNKILIDRVTGVNYFFHSDGYAGGLTPLLDPNGRPVVTPPEMLPQ